MVGCRFTFEAHAHGDFVHAVHRSLAVFNSENGYRRLRTLAAAKVLEAPDTSMKMRDQKAQKLYIIYNICPIC